MESLTHVRPSVRGAGSRVHATRALVDVCLSEETDGPDSHALLALSGWFLFLFFFFFNCEHLPLYTRTCLGARRRNVHAQSPWLDRMEGEMGEIEQYISALKRGNGTLR